MNSVVTQNIKHIVVLMMENRSFDHLFGNFPGANGISGYNYLDPTNTSSQKFVPYPIKPTSQPDFDPCHKFECMMSDIFGPGTTGCVKGKAINAPQNPSPPTMNGFVNTNQSAISGDNAYVMSYFTYPSLNVLHSLANEFVLCDNWFCDTPSETVPNRHFMHAATNMGYNNTDFWPGPENPGSTPKQNLWNANTIYYQLDQMLKNSTNWAMYGFPQDEYDSGMYQYTASKPQANRSIFDFPVDVLTGNLPFYTFIMPSLLFGRAHTPKGNANGNSMHPNGDVRLGENLIASVYNVLRNSPLWDNTLFIITFDENGGIYDHVRPPSAKTPDKDTYKVNGQVLFDYSMLGPRIPALLISPWLAKGIIDKTQYQNTSILRFVQDLFAAQNSINPAPSLTDRDKSANSIASSSAWLSTQRTSCLQTIALYEGFPNWGTEMIDPYGDDRYSGPFIKGVTKPVPVSPGSLHFAKAYCSQYPGHPDSGKPLTRSFSSHEELVKYMIERRKAARNFYNK